MAQHPAFLLIDRTAALFCGVAAGIAIGLAFGPQLNALLGDAPAQAPPAAIAPAKAEPVLLPPSSPGLARAVAQNRPFRIGVFGDSFGDGLWAALYNQLPRREAFQVLRYSQQATGFTRYRQTNLEERLAEQLAAGPVDVAVISFGANDTQGLWANGKAAALLSPGWRAEVGARATRYVQALQAQGATVVWVGLPVMRDAGYDAQVDGLNRFFAGLMADLDVTYISTRGRAVDDRGRFATHLVDPATGEAFLARASDGIHMSGRGYRRLTADLAGQLRRQARAAREGKPVPKSLVPPPVPVLVPVPKLKLHYPDIEDPSPVPADPVPATPAPGASPPSEASSPPPAETPPPSG